jgi:gliding motility-associated-like protein
VQASFSTSTVYCDAADPNSGIVGISVEGNPVGYIQYQIWPSTADPNTDPALATYNTVDLTETSHNFTGLSNGDYIIRVSTSCGFTQQTINLNNDPLIAPPPVITPNGFCLSNNDVVLRTVLPSSLYDITWTDSLGNTVGTGSSVTVNPTATETYTMTYTLSAALGCSSTSSGSVSGTANLLSDVSLVGTPTTVCSTDGSGGYTVSIEVTGTAPFNVVGTGTPGSWSGNVWTSEIIDYGVAYNVNIDDSNSCNTLNVAALAPNCCVYEVSCPTFPATTVQCYTDLPSQTSYTEIEFESLGNANGVIGNLPCGVIQITASNAASPVCEGNVIRTYTVTEYADPNNNDVRDAGEDTILNTQTCTQTFTIERLDFTMPANQGSTVACAADIVAPTVPAVTDNCGNTLTPSAPVVSATPACEGDVTYTYTFTDCEGNTHDWVYTYTIERLDFTMPANQGSTVACAADIVAPTVPAVTDNCGNTLTPSAPVVSATPACEGDVTYTYTFTDCEGNTHDWVYTYTIERADFTMPANQGSTVACAADIVAPTVPAVTDNCGNTLTPSAPVVSATPACEGNVTYTYTFTDCEGNTHDWVYTYTIERADFTMPANASSTVACAADIVAPTVPAVTDNCGNTLTPSAPVVSATPACEGDVTYTYTFTDCEGNTHDWVYTYTIERLDFTMPANQGSTVACAADIVAPTVPAVTDNCGNTLTPSAPVVSATPACEGDVTYTYTFTDCEGNTHDWVYTYTIERLDFTMPANQGSTVACAADIVAPTVPAVTDNCGNTLTPSAPVVSATPACEGDVTYTYTFTDCEGNTHDWVYTYTIERLDFTMPANQGSTVACAADIVAPTVPAVTDNCGNTLTPSAPVVSATPACEGDVTYTYTFTDCEGNTHDWVYTYTIERLDFTMPANQGSTVACAADIVAPTVPAVTDNCGNTLTPSAPVVSATPACEGDVTYTYTFTDCEGNTHDWVYTYTIERADFTMPANASSTVACAADIVAPTVPAVTDNCGNTLTPSAPVVSATPACEGDVTYTYTFTDCEGNTHDWVYTYTIERLDFTMPANQGSTVACAADIVAPTVPAVTDNCGNTLTPSAPVVSATPACEGDVTYTYTFTDCEGNTHDWVYTYTIERLDFTMPANQGSTVACAADIVAPTVPTVTDHCGNTLTASAPVVTATPACEGDVTYTYTFTDCEGNTHDWVYTYTIERVDFTMPANQGSTVACAADIVAPTVPTVTDHCGNTLTASAPVVTATPACEGDVTYTYTFTDCEGNTHDWVYTYTIERADFTMPANQGSTVSCAADIVAPTVPTVTDHCGNTLTASAPVVTATPACEGDVTYTYTFTDCEGNMHDWVYTYTIEREDFAMPANAGSTVACAADIVAPTVPEVKDNCGNVLTASAPVITNAPACEGVVTYTYTFEDCEGNTHDWVYTYTIEYNDFTLPANQASTVSCIALATAPTLPTVTDNCGNTLAVDTQWIGGTYEGCEGTRIYYYQYKDCEGNAHVWNYTYTIERNDFTVPANAGSTVACVSEVVAPTVPTVMDNCGNVLTPTGPVVTASPVCEGTITYTYTFTDCEGNAHPWVYTYTIEREDFIMPVNSGSTVACAADMVTPIAPTVTDDCGNVLTPTGPVVSAAPACEGTVTYTFTYTDCESNTHDWVYTYTIEFEDFMMPSNAGTIVGCPSEIVVPVAPVVTDHCGNTLTPTMVETATPACEGIKTYTFTYTDCAENTHDWVYTYTVDYQGDLIAPANEGSTVYAIADAIDPGAPASIIDACGRTVDAVLVGMTTIPSPFECDGQMIWTYRYTACDGVTVADWTYTYTVITSPDTPTGDPNQEFCVGDHATVADLEIIVPAGITVVWYDSPENGNVIAYNTLLADGYYFAEAVNANGCVSLDRFTVHVILDTDCDDDGVLDVEEVNGDTDLDGTVDYLDIDDDGDGILTFDEDSNTNQDWFDDDCNENGVVDYLDPQACDFIPNAFSPNGDGDNDEWVIPGLAQYPDFTLEIYDRWGNIVYEYKNAGRTTPDWWDGLSNGRWNYSSDEILPTGTYFYIINYNEGTKEPSTGWVYLQNNND